ncbi:TetR family transcriptional regulator [Lentzea guizhouensis]|uniref:TetR family transcriptional regulator n=1 Tax=Lentzea guizhouensis TaxID=1586287 RepID=A0A1B2HJW8_9PSEU|nr:TetR family transcriptional regulator [Lentzea guizhouensis]ANZ38019.1 TetR family transcriptional regulator [Lentzea guizhouensis]
MARDKEATKAKLLEAALTEFAAHGIAGARVDRIAAKAGCNKAMIYAYFGSKEDLFDEVLKIQITRVVEAVPITPEDLPGYAGRLFETYERQPELLSLAGYHRLENGFEAISKAEADAHVEKVAAIAAAQERGELPREFTAEELLNLTVHMSILAFSTPVASRELVVCAVKKLIAP